MTPVVIALNYFPPSTNNLFPGNGKRRFISKEYEIWKEAAGWQLAQHRIKPIRGCQVELLFQLSPPKSVTRYRDCSNYVKAPEDLLISHGILAGDDQRYVRRVISEWSDDEIAGVIITITPLQKPYGARQDVLAQPGSLK